MGSETAVSSAQLKRAGEGGGGKCDSVSGGGSRSMVDMEDIGGSGGLSSSSSCVCVLLSTVTLGTGGGGLIRVGIGSLTAVSVSLVEALALTNDGSWVWVLDSLQAGGWSQCKPWPPNIQSPCSSRRPSSYPSSYPSL